MTAERITRIRECLGEALAPSSLEIVDESHLHVGHPGARDGRGHFSLQIVSSRFQARNAMQRHRMVYDALGELMSSDIHAVRIKALTPEESGHRE
ncbi:MAG: BolA family protein [Gammaproteobacteria bacterium]